MLKIATIVGARPQFVKAGSLSPALAERGIEEVLIHTGQHYDQNMSTSFFTDLPAKSVDYNLSVGSGKHGEMTGKMLIALEPCLESLNLDGVLVYGDTNSTLAGALVASKLQIPVFHVEAGLRIFDFAMPEEINRRLTDHISEICFTPSATATLNLRNEGIAEKHINEAGDIGHDILLMAREWAGQKSTILEDLNLKSGGFIVATIHRPHNTDDLDRLKIIADGLLHIHRSLAPVVWPCHPRTLAALESQGWAEEMKQAGILIEPVGYLDMVRLMDHCSMVVTDSGGLQRESFYLGKPCLVLKDGTEWVELVEGGWVHLLDMASTEILVEAITRLNGHQGQTISPYGDGNTRHRIADALLAWKAGR